MYIKDEKFVEDYLNESLKIAKTQLSYNKKIITVAKNIYEKIQSGGSILICGNGGSASDSQHIAAEFVNRFKHDREPIASVALTTDSSIITSIANDYSFDLIFSKQIDAIGKNNDVLIAISTSGRSKNILEALKAAKLKNIYTLSMVGESTGDVKEFSDDIFSIPSKETGVVQQSHITILQVIAGLIEFWSLEESQNQSK
tara:strand:- start:590 stop:1189 length:600 start_codon:yes stop_codon:yes gene_type:complete